MLISKKNLTIVILLGSLFLVSCKPDISGQKTIERTEYEEINGTGLTTVSASGDLSLIVDFDDLNIIVENSEDGRRWSVSPEDLYQETIAGEEYQEYMKSQFEITYIYERNVRTVNSYAESVKNGQYRIFRINDGVRIEYQLGNMSLTIEDIPKMLSAERADELILNNEELTEEQREVFLSAYEIDENTGAYAWKSNNFGSKQKNAINLFAAIDYSQEDLISDSAMFGIEIDPQEKIYFIIPVEYVIRDGRFSVNVPVDEIEYPEQYPVLNISLCPFFAAQKNDEPGYIFMPDGSGVLIEFDEDDTRTLSLNVYSNDISTGTPVKPIVSRPVLLPVFGIKSGESAVLGIIEEGDAISMITAIRAGRNSGYNSVGASFTVRAKDNMDLSGVTTIPADVTVLQKDMYHGDITLSYAFLSGESADYSGMAVYYRDYLEKSGYFLSKPSELSPEIPLYIETIGAVTANQSFLGFNYEGPEALTTFRQSSDIFADFRSEGITNLNLKISGWFNGGTQQGVASSIKMIRELGTRQELKELSQNTSAFLDVKFLMLSDIAGLSLSRYSARKPDQQYVRTYLNESEKGHVLSVSYLEKLTDKFIKDLRKLDFPGIAVSDLGNLACADYSRKNNVDRQESVSRISASLASLSSVSGRLMLNEANIHTAKYALHITGSPFGGSGYYTALKEVPFYQMVFHGYVNYSDIPMNLSSTYETDFLKAAEYGGGLYYKLIARDMTEIKGLYESELFSAYYEDWKTKCISDYMKLNELLDGLNNVRITGHRYINETCTETEYENGTKVIVNYSGDTIMADGTSIPAKSAVRVEGK